MDCGLKGGRIVVSPRRSWAACGCMYVKRLFLCSYQWLQAAWMLLSEFVGHTKSIDMDFLVRSWEAHVSVEDQSRRGVGEGRGRECGEGGEGEWCVKV